MSITDELREWAEGNALRAGMSLRTVREQALAIADRIDAEHERQLGVLYRDMSDAEYVKLPEDADGVPIRVGDVMVYADGNTKPMEVVALVPPAVFLTEEGPRYADMCRHYHAPTVEDVLREFVTEFNRDDSELCDGEIIERFAAKLQLKEDA